ncbi:MAG: cytochrome b/b6 domain-containing protein [Aestuariivirgaceae bacterium]|nr:cytochrome b/b6 domain-containing protein [Aestuariivirgaceae bacterium]
MTNMKVWDIFVRVFHWSLVICFSLNALILDDESRWHPWVGYAVMGLLATRILWGFLGTKYARFNSFPPDFSQAVGQLREMASPKAKIHVGHTPLGALMIYNLIATLITICASGYLMTTDMFWGVEWPETVHETAVAWAEICIVLHIAAVLLESVRTRINLPRAMVTGYKRIP